MKITNKDLRAMILEELKAVRGETLTESEEYAETEEDEDLDEVEESYFENEELDEVDEVEEGVGQYGSPEGRAAADDSFDAALETLRNAVQSGRASIEQVLAALRGGAEAGETWHDNINVGRMGEAEEVYTQTGTEPNRPTVEALEETQSLTSEMAGHIEAAEEEEGRQPVQESFNNRRLAKLAGILED
tara:strand:- start:23263 stop:23829 length:567 start_codon:yes stop_codon:yes gene_type:complete